MKALIIAYQTIEDELNFVLKDETINLPVIYTEAGLHSYPDRLKEYVQKTINQIENVDFILLGYALCGNGLIGLSSNRATLVLPQYHDCVAMLLGSDDRYRSKLSTDTGALFLTQGMMKYFNPKKTFYESVELRLGPEKALRYTKYIFKNYRKFEMVETGAFDPEALFQEIQSQAEFFDLQASSMTGTVDVLRKLVQCQWDDNFQIVPPGQKIKTWDFHCVTKESLTV